jgi:acetyl-CoA/propionyl-CoA carboxylase, biotin carboxylase, biotin carboxyl carrier protein
MTNESGYRRIDTMLVANRGEIAVRIIRACRELGIRTIAVFGDGDEDALHVQLADEAHRIPGHDGLPYLRQDAIVELAIGTAADAVHPGYGFLSENADFAERVMSASLTFVGPGADAIRAMGDKVAARRIASEAGVRPVPGSDGSVSTVAEARELADAIGYPIAVKASGGGGGRGFRLARAPQDLAAAFDGSRGEAERYFSNPEVYLERYLDHPRHIEVQVFGDSHGALIALGERDCSVQRRHQKLIEETPSPAVSPQLRERLLDASERLARAVEYIGAGTIEYLLDADGSFYFLEMNTRIQVEHTVTEMVSGVDLVKEQIRVAEGAPLSFGVEVRDGHGWSIQCRINAEDPGHDFAPVPGTLAAYREPAGFGVRVDSAMSAGSTIHAGYDSMIAKLITWGVDRDEAIARMQRCLSDYHIEGVPTTIAFHQRVLAHPAFREAGATTTFITDYPDVIPPSAGATEVIERSERRQERVLVEVNGQRFDVIVLGDDEPASNPGTADQRRRPQRHASRRSSGSGGNGNDLVSPIQGTTIRVGVCKGDRVEAGQLICVVEAMKMENELVAHQSGTVGELMIEVGTAVKMGDIVATIEPA